MADIKIEVYKSSHQRAVGDLIIKIQRDEFGVPITLENQPDLFMIESFYQKGNGNFWVAMHNEIVVGTIALIDIGNSQVALRKMFVDQNFRGKPFNTGQLLMDEAFRWMSAKKVTEVFLGTIEVFEAARHFYIRNGFIQVPMNQLPSTFPRMPLDTTFFKKVLPQDVQVVEYDPIYQPWFEKLNRDWIEKYFWMEPVDFQVLQNPDEHIVNKGGTIFMAICEKEVAGTVALKYVEDGIFEFTKMAVDERFRGKKIGKALALAAISKAKAQGANKIILYSNTILETAIELYRKLGFTEIPLDGPYKRSNIKMQLPLK